MGDSTGRVQGGGGRALPRFCRTCCIAKCSKSQTPHPLPAQGVQEGADPAPRSPRSPDSHLPTRERFWGASRRKSPAHGIPLSRDATLALEGHSQSPAVSEPSRWPRTKFGVGKGLAAILREALEGFLGAGQELESGE